MYKKVINPFTGKFDLISVEDNTFYRVDSWEYNDITFDVENVVNTFQDTANDARGAVVDGNNNVKYYLFAGDHRFKENGQAANIYGFTTDTDVTIGGTVYNVKAADFGNVVIQFGKMYFSHIYLANKHYYQQSKYNFSGSQLHPAFRNYDSVAGETVDVDYCNIGKYEGVLFDASKNRCVNGIYINASITSVAATKTITPAASIQYLKSGDIIKETSAVLGAVNSVYTVDTVTLNADSETTSFTVLEAINTVGTATAVTLRNDIDTSADKLMSVSGYKPVTYIDQAEARTLAENNNSGALNLIGQQKHSDWFLIQMLGATKMSTLNIQTYLGAGKTGSDPDYKFVSITGLSNASGMSNFIDNTQNKQLIGGSALFAIENLYGNLWKWLDNLKVDDWVVSLADNNSQTYQATAINLPNTNGYWGRIVNTDKGIFPASIDGGSGDDIGDSFYQSAGNRVGLSAGYLDDSAYCGLSYLSCYYPASVRFWYYGARFRS